MVGTHAIAFLQRNVMSVLIGVCMLAAIVIAVHDATTSSGATTFYILEDSATLFNITINISDANQSANISSVTVTLPASFSFSAGSQNTSGNANHAFTSNSTFLNWTNTSFYFINGSSGNTPQYVWFNASATTPGSYSFVVTTMNGTATFNPRNLTVVVNDSTAPTSLYLIGNNSMTRSATFNFSGNFSDVINITRIIIYVWNSTHSLVNSTVVNTSVTGVNGIANFTIPFPAQDRYYYNFLTNDTANNTAFNATNFTIVYDATAPSVSLSKSSSTTTSLTLTITITDALAGMNNSCSVSGRSGANVSGTTTSQTITESSLSCGTNYTYDVSCVDAAGNTGTASSSWGTSSCSSETSTSSGGGGSTTVWTSTFIAESGSLEAGYTREIAAKERIRVAVSGKDHHVGVLEVTSTQAKIEVSSAPQQATLSIGESKKFEVTNDSVYDLAVTVRSITEGKVNLTIYSISEPFTPGTDGSSSGSINGTATVGGMNASDETEMSSPDGAKKGVPTFLWVIMVILLISLGIVLFYIYRRK